VPRVDQRFEVAVGRAHDPHVDVDLAVGADGADPTLLQSTQQRRLLVDGHLPDLVEEERAAVRRREQTLARLLRPREGATDVAEELAGEDVTAIVAQLSDTSGPARPLASCKR